MACIVMAYIVMACPDMTYTVMAYIVTTRRPTAADANAATDDNSHLSSSYSDYLYY